MKPNLFLLGAGKCGTTSLANVLGRHPDIHVNAYKEPSFFCSYFQVVSNPVVYFSLFDSPKRYRVDASHVYFSNPETAPILKDLFPEAKFLVIMRDPKKRAYALYRHMRRYVAEDGLPYEDIKDFIEALKAEPYRATSAEFWINFRQYAWNFLYCCSSLYDQQLARYFALFDRSQFHLLTLAEFSRNPREALSQIADFLKIDASPFVSLNSFVFNADEAHQPYSAEAEQLMNQNLAGVTARVEALIGHQLDWSK